MNIEEQEFSKLFLKQTIERSKTPPSENFFKLHKIAHQIIETPSDQSE